MRYQSRAPARFRDTMYIIYKRAITIADRDITSISIYRREINLATRIEIKSALSLLARPLLYLAAVIRALRGEYQNKR